MTTSIYTPAQLEAYLLHISFPTLKYPQISSQAAKTKDGLEYLSLLQKYHLATVPFENLSLHYSRQRMLSLDNDDLYQKIVVNKRGGYCMENNQFFGNVLRSFGFEVVRSGARVFGGDVMGGWNHQITLVVIDGAIYLVDVGFGGGCPTRPLKLVADEVSPWGSTNASNRLLVKPASIPLIQPLWFLQTRISNSDEWKSLYGFTLTEFFPKDFEIMNFSTSNSKSVIFTFKIIVVKTLLDENEDDAIGTVWIEDRLLKRRIRGEVEELKAFKNEQERVEALQEWFNVSLSDKEQDSIKATVTELRDEGMN